MPCCARVGVARVLSGVRARTHGQARASTEGVSGEAAQQGRRMEGRSLREGGPAPEFFWKHVEFIDPRQSCRLLLQYTKLSAVGRRGGGGGGGFIDKQGMNVGR